MTLTRPQDLIPFFGSCHFLPKKCLMTVKLFLKIVFLATLAVHPAHAENSPAGEEIILPAGEDPTQDSPLAASEELLPDEPSRDTGNETAKTSVAQENGLWQRIKSGFTLPELHSPFTTVHESWYAARPDYMKRMMERSQRYLYHIVQEVERRDMPLEIALLPMVESAFNPQAYSTSKASGIWQFIPSTGRHFGLRQDRWADNRRDVKAATDAALTYLQKLHIMFGSWDLALAAYNAGEGTVMRAIERNRKKGLPTDYQSLKLPAETRNYVPKLQAVKNIISNPERYGINIEPIPNQPYFTAVSAPRQIDARLAARLAGISLEELRSLNPQYKRPLLTATSGNLELLLPVGSEQIFARNLESHDKPLATWRTYRPQRGENQKSIAHKFGMDVAQLRDVNGLSARGTVKTQQDLLVLAGGSEAESQNAHLPEATTSEPASVDISAKLRHHTVKKGETAARIANRHGISLKRLLAANHLPRSAQIKPGMVLTLPTKTIATRTAQSAHTGQGHYVVRKGDTLFSIARRFDIAVGDLRRWNNLNGTRVVPGHRLTIQKPDAA